MLVLAVFAAVLAPYDPVAVDFGAMLAAPNGAHWLGTDAFGRDVLSRLIYGSRTALLVGFGAALMGATIGAVLGVGSAYFGGLVDLYLQRLMDIFLSFPLIILALALVAILGNSIPNVIMAITIPDDPARGARHPLLRADDPRDAVRGRGARRRLRPRAHHPAPHAAERGRVLPDHADRVPGPGHPGSSPRCPSWASACRSRRRPGG